MQLRSEQATRHSCGGSNLLWPRRRGEGIPLEWHSPRALGAGFGVGSHDWLIAGGESGPGYRRVRVEWLRELRDACERAGVAFFFKQWGGRTPKSGGRELDGETHDAIPNVQLALVAS